jgi:hypothetical protein
MKTTATLIACFFLMVCISQAQPVITAANYPVAGETYHGTIQFNPTNYGVPGANVTWDFSNLTNATPGPLAYDAPSSTSYATSFPTANVAVNFSIVTLFYNTTSTKVDVCGSVSSNVVIPYKNPQTAITFPFTYLDEFKDTARSDSIVTASNKRRIRTTYSHSLADGYGTLIMPGPKTYTNVTRLRITALTTDSNFTNGIFASRDVYNDTSYYYFAENFKPHVLWMEKDSSSAPISFYEYFTDPASTTGISTPIINISKVYPNPTHHEITIDLDQSRLNGSSDLSFCLINKKGEYTLNKTLDSFNKKFSVQGFLPGVYIYLLKRGNDVIDTGKLTIE